MMNPILKSQKPALCNMECFKVIKNNIEFLAKKNNMKSILITSTKDGEGKTAVALNLATILAQEGKKVLIIDGSCSPSSEEKDEASEQSYLNETTIKNLYMLSWEDYIDEHPGTQKLAEMAGKLKESFDFIIIDSPSAARLSAIQDLSRYADSCILVIKAGETDVSEAKKLINQLTKLNVNIMGAILNENTDSDYSEQYMLAGNTKARFRKGSGIGFKRKYVSKTALMN